MTNPAPDDVDELSDRYVDEYARLDPCGSSLMGITGHDGDLTDYSPEGFAARDALNRRTLAALAALPDPGPVPGGRVGAGGQGSGGARAQIATRLLREHLEREIAYHEAGVTTAGLAPIDSSIPALRRSIELLDRGPATPWPDLLSRLRALPGSLAGLRDTLTSERQLGRVAARRQVINTAVQCERTADYLPRLGAAHGDGPLRDPIAAATAAGAQALEDFARFLRTDLAPHAPHRDALGPDRYRLGAQYYLGTTLDLDDTYAWGWAELAAIETEMAAVADEIAPGAGVAKVIEMLDRDPTRRVAGADAVRDHLQQLADRAIAELDGVHFGVPEPLRRIDCRITPTTIGGVSYLPPAEDLTRPGQVWWTLPDDELPTWTVPSTMYHEGAPGHHLQQGTVMCRADRFNRFQRAATEWSFSGHVEGWGLYAERLMGELGYYADPAHRLGMLTQHRFRAARVVLDIGLHLELEIPRGSGFHEGERWTPDLGREFLTARCGLDDFTARFEIDRYLGRPGQAAAYKVGERVWLAAREDARRRLGAAFELRTFHAAALDLGTMGLDAFRAELAGLFTDGQGRRATV